MQTQETYAKNLEVQNLFHRSEEDLEQIVVCLAGLLGASLQAEEIDSCLRLPYGAADRPKPVVIIFKDKHRRDEVFRARTRKFVKWRDLAAALGDQLRQDEDPEERVYVNQYLSPYFRKLYHLAKRICRRLGIKFCWYNNCKVLIRYPENSSTLLAIEAVDDLQQLSNYGTIMRNVVESELENERAFQMKSADQRGFKFPRVAAAAAEGGNPRRYKK